MVAVIANQQLQWFSNHIFQQIFIFFAMRWQISVIQNEMMYNIINVFRTSFKCLKTFWETKRLDFLTTSDVRISSINEVKDRYKFLK